MLLVQQSLFRCLLYYVNHKTGASLPCNLKFQSNIQYYTVQYSTIQYNTVLYSTIQYYKVQYSTIQYNTVHYRALQCSAVHYSVKHSVLECIPFQYSEAYSSKKTLEVLWNAVFCVVFAWQA